MRRLTQIEQFEAANALALYNAAKVLDHASRCIAAAPMRCVGASARNYDGLPVPPRSYEACCWSLMGSLYTHKATHYEPNLISVCVGAICSAHPRIGYLEQFSDGSSQSDIAHVLYIAQRACEVRRHELFGPTVPTKILTAQAGRLNAGR